MPIEFEKGLVRMQGIVSVDEAEGLLEWLQNKPATKIDLSDCKHLHPANLQVLMACGCKVSAWPLDSGLRSWLETALPSLS